MTMHIVRWDLLGYGGKTYDRGEIIELKGVPNDEKLVGIGYITELTERSPRILECGECGAKFVDDANRLAHGRRHHPHRERLPDMVPASISPLGEPSVFIDTEGDREEKRRMEETPLYLEKTQASMRG